MIEAVLKHARTRRWKPEGEPDTPYARARAEWDSRLGTARAQAASWRFFALACLLLAGGCAAAMVYLARLPKQVVEVVEVDRVGRARYLGPAGTSWANWQPTPEQTAYHLRRFIRDTRTLSSDHIVTRQLWLDAYAMLAGEAINILNTEAAARDPFERSRTERVTVAIESVLPLSQDTWQADWTEEVWSNRGTLQEKAHWRGTFIVERIKPRDAQTLKSNPLGLYVTHFSWARVGQ